VTDVSLDALLGEVSTHNPDEVRDDGDSVLYRGYTERDSRRWTVTRRAPGMREQPLRHISKHSPTGFAWGYAGSGPAELARCLLIDALGDAALCPTCLGRRRIVYTGSGETDSIPAPPGEAGMSCYACDAGYGPLVERAYQAFKFAVVGRWPIDEPWAITQTEVLSWLREHQGARVEQ